MADRRVLLVTAEPAYHVELHDKLAGVGARYVVDSANGLSEAVACCAQDNLDVILLDMRLSDAGGLQAVARLREVRQELPIVVLATDADRPLAAEAVKAGAQDYLVKDRVCGHLLVRALDYAVERKRLESIAHLAHYDGLTGLATRTLFRDRAQTAIARSKRTGTQLAVIYLDLDKFKPINDRYGHDTGDAVLKEVARRLHENVRATDTVARFGGDEMVVLVESVSDESASTVVDKLSAALVAPISIGGEILDVGVSIGVAMHPRDGGSMEDLLHNADCAMYESKRRGAGPVFFRPELSAVS
ncbi:MAG: GGDEF domain-containing response regulator [Pseudomonadota bacterium]|nr:GGDEF domain-containing response regulator [Pseudomonadota bacterium]